MVEVDHRVLPEQRRADEGKVGQQRHCEGAALAELLADEADADEGREAVAEQAQRQPGGVLVGVEPDHQRAEGRGQQAAGQRAGGEGQRVAAGGEGGGKAGDRGHQHHALGAQVEDAGAFVEQQAQAGQRQRGAGEAAWPRPAARSRSCGGSLPARRSRHAGSGSACRRPAAGTAAGPGRRRSATLGSPSRDCAEFTAD